MVYRGAWVLLFILVALLATPAVIADIRQW
jgi:hypothetical protein